MDGKTRRESMREEREKLKDMTFSQKLGYVWTYYKHIFFGAVVLALIVILSVMAMRSAKQESVLNVALIDATKVTGNEVADMERSFADELSLDERTQCVAFDDSYYIDLESGDQMTMASQTKLMAAIRGETIDVMLLPEDVYKNYLTSGACKSLEDVLDADLLEEVKDRTHLDRGEEDDTDRVYALDVTDSGKLQDIYDSEDGKIYLTVTVRAHNTENIQKFVEYLLED